MQGKHIGLGVRSEAIRQTVAQMNSPLQNGPAPRWTAVLALLTVAVLYEGLPTRLLWGPHYLLLGVIVSLTIPTVWSHRAGHHDLNQILGTLVNGLQTLALTVSVVLLLSGLPSHRETPIQLLHGASLLWGANVFIFALWYWRLDAGGPHRRDARQGHSTGAFLFPQMTLSPGDANYDADWSPDFIDYLFLAFNSSTALSPTDTAVFSRWAKASMMLQALISLALVAVLAARAVNGL